MREGVLGVYLPPGIRIVITKRKPHVRFAASPITPVPCNPLQGIFSDPEPYVGLDAVVSWTDWSFGLQGPQITRLFAGEYADMMPRIMMVRAPGKGLVAFDTPSEEAKKLPNVEMAAPAAFCLEGDEWFKLSRRLFNKVPYTPAGVEMQSKFRAVFEQQAFVLKSIEHRRRRMSAIVSLWSSFKEESRSLMIRQNVMLPDLIELQPGDMVIATRIKIILSFGVDHGTTVVEPWTLAWGEPVRRGQIVNYQKCPFPGGSLSESA